MKDKIRITTNNLLNDEKCVICGQEFSTGLIVVSLRSAKRRGYICPNCFPVSVQHAWRCLGGGDLPDVFSEADNDNGKTTVASA